MPPKGDSKEREVREACGGRKTTRIAMMRHQSHRFDIKCEAPAAIMRPTEAANFATELFMAAEVMPGV